MFWLVDGRQVDVEWDPILLVLVQLPQLILELATECRFASARVSKQEEHPLIALQELLDLFHQWEL